MLARLRLGFAVFGEREVPGLTGVRGPADVVDHLWGFVEDQECLGVEGLALRDLGLKRREESIIMRWQFALRRRESQKVIDKGPQRSTCAFLKFLLISLQFRVIDRERSAIIQRVAILQQRSRQQHQPNIIQIHLIHIDLIGSFRRDYAGYFLRRCVTNSIPMKASSYLDIFILSAF